jgi:hypothetical protein
MSQKILCCFLQVEECRNEKVCGGLYILVVNIPRGRTVTIDSLNRGPECGEPSGSMGQECQDHISEYELRLPCSMNQTIVE